MPSRLAIGTSPRDEGMQGHVMMLLSKLRGEWGAARGIKDLQKSEALSSGGLYWEIYTGEISEKGLETLHKALNDFSFAEMEGISLPMYILTHPASKSNIKIEVNGKPIRIGGGLR